MFLKRFYEPTLAQASYMIGCAETHEAIVIDPNRDVDQYIKAAADERARITHITETHIHADFVSGARELAARTGATLYLSAEGGADWQYAFAAADGAVLIKNGSRLKVGNILIDAVHTPGHTPEHLSFVVTDTAGATEPIGVATGDFVFVGDVGRPDLLEKAAQMKGTMEAGAKTLFHSLTDFSRRPDWLQIWPGHGAGSACGKGISAIPTSTLGYERRFNWAFKPMAEAEFVKSVLAGQPDPPKYFAEMKRVNKQGPRVLGGFTRPARLGAEAMAGLLKSGALVVDTRKAMEFAVGHIPGTINIPQNASFTTYAGWLVPYSADFYVIVDSTAGALDTVVKDLAMIGLDRIAGYFDASAVEAWAASSGRAPGTVPQLEARDLAQSLRHGGVTLVDVRNDNEWTAGHVSGAIHVPLGHLLERLDEVPKTKPVALLCHSGGRSSIGASLLLAHGFDRAINLTGGISAWIEQGLPVATA
jgi:hydroxyacylglutathione hydrolase